MLTILGVTFPFFALVLAGYVAAKRGWLPLTAIPGLNSFVLYFALPAMLFRFGANTPMAQLLDGSVALLYTLSATLMVLPSGPCWRDLCRPQRMGGGIGSVVALTPCWFS